MFFEIDKLTWITVIAAVLTSALVSVLMELFLFSLTRKTISKEIDKLIKAQFADRYPSEVHVSRREWRNMQYPFKQDGGRYQPTGENPPEYAFYAVDSGVTSDDDTLIFRLIKE